jgi:hypothetical protein
MSDDLVKRLRDSRYDGQLMMRTSAADRIEQLEAALADAMQHVSRAKWYYLKPETRAALGEKKDD